MKLSEKLVWLFFVAVLILTLGSPIPLTSAAEGVIVAVDIGLYWDEERSLVVSSFDFGTVARGQSESVTFWLANEGDDKGRISLELDNFSPSSHGIVGYLERRNGKSGYVSNWNKKIKMGDLWEVRCTVELAQDVEIGVYAWDLIVRCVFPDDTYYLFVPCFIYVN